MDKLLRDIFRIIIWLVYISLIVFIAYQIIKAIKGGTWQTENIIIASLGIITAGMFSIIGFLISQNKTIGILEERTKNIGQSLTNLGNDFKKHINK